MVLYLNQLMPKNHISLFILLSLFINQYKAQFYNLPNDYLFALLTEKQMAAKDSSIHTGVKPYIHFYSNKYAHVKDSHRIYKYVKDDEAIETLFFNHLLRVEPKNENFKLRVDPIINLERGRDFSDTIDWKPFVNTRGLIASGYIGNNFYIETMFAENQSRFPDYIAKNNRNTKIIPGQGAFKTFKTYGFDYAFSSGFISIQATKNLNIQIGHGKQKIGSGYRSLLLSDNSFNYPFARITQQWFKGRLQYTNIYAVLTNLVPSSVIRTSYTERLWQKKAASFQYLSLNVNKAVNLGFFQGMIWQAGDDHNAHDLTWQYFNPLIYSNMLSYGLNNKNNILLGADLKVKITNQLNVYAQSMLDRVLIYNGKLASGFQVGFNYFDAFGIKNLFFQMEYNNVVNGNYASPSTATTQSYSHYNQNLAFTPGYGRELVCIADYKYRRFFANIKYNYQDVPQKTYVNLVNVRVGYLINPAYNLNISAGFNYRNENFYTFKNSIPETSYLYLGLRTTLYNFYYDF